MAKPIHVYQTYIRADVARVWQAITDPAFTARYFHAQRFESSLEPGTPYRFVGGDGTTSVEGTVVEADPPRRLVITWRVLYDVAAAEEPPSTVEWELAEAGDGLTKVTTIHRDLGRSPVTSAGVGDGWYWVLGSLKSLVETGEGLPRPDGPDAPIAPAAVAGAGEGVDEDGEDHRRHAVDANNSTWDLLGRDDLDADEADDLLGRAYAASYHWRRAARRGPENAARASWLVSRAHTALGHGELALHHADRCLAAVAAAGLEDFDLAYAREARARALACLGRPGEAAEELAAARAVPIADDEDRKIVVDDLAAGPWYGLATAGPTLDP